MIERTFEPLVRDDTQLGRKRTLDELIRAYGRGFRTASKPYGHCAGRQNQRDWNVVADISHDAFARGSDTTRHGLRIVTQAAQVSWEILRCAHSGQPGWQRQRHGGHRD